MEQENSCYMAKTYFSERDHYEYSHSMFEQWYMTRDSINLQSGSMKKASGGGRKPTLGALEEVLFDEIIELRMRKIKVTRTFISDRPIALAA